MDITSPATEGEVCSGRSTPNSWDNNQLSYSSQHSLNSQLSNNSTFGNSITIPEQKPCLLLMEKVTQWRRIDYELKSHISKIDRLHKAGQTGSRWHLEKIYDLSRSSAINGHSLHCPPFQPCMIFFIEIYLEKNVMKKSLTNTIV
ncbi:hypothetical protein AVEN_123737-1 [Araneus ventricosus]|uniref:Uncharacterized protein n=1 Tax=Araneus ventricosus TaxID=182803 RepID=A0A4Y2BKR7_ARAVE|nr:hypothetical protein AVEN_123737-1 [Araneus ventricosus]